MLLGHPYPTLFNLIQLMRYHVIPKAMPHRRPLWEDPTVLEGKVLFESVTDYTYLTFLWIMMLIKNHYLKNTQLLKYSTYCVWIFSIIE